MTKIIPDAKAKTVTFEFSSDELKSCLISRAIYDLQSEGWTLDLSKLTLGNFSFGPFMSARVKLSVLAEPPTPAAVEIEL